MHVALVNIFTSIARNTTQKYAHSVHIWYIGAVNKQWNTIKIENCNIKFLSIPREIAYCQKIVPL